MTDSVLHVPKYPVRFVTATALFDGHDAAINIMRRILQQQGAEVIHLGHNRSVSEIVDAAIQEDVNGIAVSSYQGGHNEFFTYLVDLLRERGATGIRVFGGGGGVIVPDEIASLEAYGVARIFSPEDGAQLGLARMVNTMIEACDVDPATLVPAKFAAVTSGDTRALARAITEIMTPGALPEWIDSARRIAADRAVPVIGITGTGGSGKSSLTDELVRRVRLDQRDALRIAIVAIDPTRRRGGGALLGDRIRMNAIDHPNVFFRSLATRGDSEVPEHLDAVIATVNAAGYDLIIVETPGIGQGDAGIVGHVDVPIYVMTPEFGSASQLEKIDMLDFAEAVVINKFDRRGGEDAVRDVRRQYARNRELFQIDPTELPVFGTIASRFNDDGVTALYQHLGPRLLGLGLTLQTGALAPVDTKTSTGAHVIVPAARSRYLAEIAESIRAYHEVTDQQVAAVRRVHALETAHDLVSDTAAGPVLADRVATARLAVMPETAPLLAAWPEVAAQYRDPLQTYRSLSGTCVPHVVVPDFGEPGALLKFLRSENLPGRFPFTAGVFAFKRPDEDPTRMFAGEGDPFRTNARFHLLAADAPATRLSTAFDSVTLYGCDPDERPDIYGKVGNSGVSVATLDDMKALYAGFDLDDPKTSVSMTINGPAATVLAMYFNTAIDAAVEQFVATEGREPSAEESARIRAEVLRTMRGTVQADVLKEDQGQNTCILSTEFSLGLMADVQEWFVANQVHNFYSVSISGYHIAEAGANPISQLAFTLANGFTYVEAYLARGMDIDDFAPNLSFFFSNGMDPEYSVLGRVARRIWAVAMRDKYGANERSQKLKYHIQTSGRSLHAQEINFNDIRTTLQALIAIYDHCNSLHTNAYDEAITTPTEESVRRALAIQLIINREWGVAKNQNPNQGSYLFEELTDLVEEAVLAEFERINERGGVLGAMELGYQRGRIQDESMLYEQMKHDGSLPIVGVNTFRRAGDSVMPEVELRRSTEAEKCGQLERLREFQSRNAAERPAVLERLRQTALAGDNVFAVLMDAVRVCTLGEITNALYEVGGRYRRNV
ncbi:MAG: fused isobutyryl-CoA mutase/GTPase IcmF [Acidimicrobiia bacterium]